VSLEGGPPVRVTGDTYLDTSPVWTSDGRGLLYVSNADGERDAPRGGRPASAREQVQAQALEPAVSLPVAA